MSEPEFHKAPGKAKYKGDVSQEVLGQIMGPTTYNTFLGAFQAEYDEATDTTTVLFQTVSTAG